MLRSRSRVLALLAFFEEAPALPRFRQESISLSVLLFELIDILRQVPCFSAGASLLFEVSSCVLSSIFGAHGIRSHFRMTPCDGPLLSRVFTACNGPLENLIVWFDPNFPTSRRIDFFWLSSWDTHKPIVQSPSIRQLVLFHRSSLTFYWAAHQLQHVRNDDRHHICILIQTCNLGIRDGAINHTTVPCTFLPGSFYTLFCFSIRKDFLLWDRYLYQAFSVSLRWPSWSRRG